MYSNDKKEKWCLSRIDYDSLGDYYVLETTSSLSSIQLILGEKSTKVFKTYKEALNYCQQVLVLKES